MQKHVVLLAIGIVLGIGAVAYLGPKSESGATLLVFVVLVVVYAVGLVVIQLTKRMATNSNQPRKR